MTTLLLILLIVAAILLWWLTKPGLIKTVSDAIAAKSTSTEDTAAERITVTYRQALKYLIALRFSDNPSVTPSSSQRPKRFAALRVIGSNVLVNGSFKNATAGVTDIRPAANTTERSRPRHRAS